MQYHAEGNSSSTWDVYWFEKNLQGDIVADIITKQQSLCPTFMTLGVILRLLTTMAETVQPQPSTRSDTEVIITIPTLDCTILIQDIMIRTQGVLFPLIMKAL